MRREGGGGTSVIVKKNEGVLHVPVSGSQVSSVGTPLVMASPQRSPGDTGQAGSVLMNVNLNFTPTPPPIHPPVQRKSDFAAPCRLIHGRMPQPAVHLHSVRRCTYGFLRTMPHDIALAGR